MICRDLSNHLPSDTFCVRFGRKYGGSELIAICSAPEQIEGELEGISESAIDLGREMCLYYRNKS